MRVSAEQKGDILLERWLYLMRAYNRAELPNGTKLAPSIQQEEFDMKVTVALLPLFYGSAYQVKIIREKIMKRLGVGTSHKIVMIQMNRQCGKTTRMMQQIAALSNTMPLLQIVTGHQVDVGKKLVSGVAQFSAVLHRYATDIRLPQLDKKRESVNHLIFLWDNGATGTVQRITASPKRYVTFLSLTHTHERTGPPLSCFYCTNTFLCLLTPLNRLYGKPHRSGWFAFTTTVQKPVMSTTRLRSWSTR